MAASLYTVTVRRAEDDREIASRYFQTLRGARNWRKWLRTHSWVVEANIYRGSAGAERVE